ncbi:MAG: DNA phosphorothioation-associated protein 4 [Cyanobacteria bacterium J06639_14]
MADIRIKIAKDKAKLVKALRAGEGSTGPFQTYYEVLAFAAAVGMKHKRFHSFSEDETSKEIDPIRQEQFASKGYEQLINLISLTHIREPSILSDDESFRKRRVEVFEAYSNGGLDFLMEVLHGANDYRNQIILILTAQKSELVKRQNPEDILDWDIMKNILP